VVVYDVAAMAETNAKRVALYTELRQAEIAKREHADDVRRAAWAIVGGSAGKWRDGFQRMYRVLVRTGGDLDSIPHHDTLARELGWYYPEWTNRTEELWAFLLSDRVPMPSSASTWRTVDGILGEYEPIEVCVAQRNAMPF
jgi:hypothetical protein